MACVEACKGPEHHGQLVRPEAVQLGGRHGAHGLQCLPGHVGAGCGQGPHHVGDGHGVRVVAGREACDKGVSHLAEQALAGIEADCGKGPGGHGEAASREEFRGAKDVVVRQLEQDCVLDLQLGKAPEDIGELKGLEGPKPADSQVAQGRQHVCIVKLQLCAGPSDRGHATLLRSLSVLSSQTLRQEDFGLPPEHHNAWVGLQSLLVLRIQPCDAMPGRAGIHKAHFLAARLNEFQHAQLAALRCRSDPTVQPDMRSRGVAVTSSLGGLHEGAATLWLAATVAGGSWAARHAANEYPALPRYPTQIQMPIFP
mmetsp:Transcript_39623/g.94836  ORF Transcript_39623/g.94836 Transcript_39623/m.94836 type:complete len:312 (-) Transcript_39623:19-954(-)